MKKKEINIVLGDFKVGQDKTENVTTDHNLGICNKRGKQFIQF